MRTWTKCAVALSVAAMLGAAVSASQALSLRRVMREKLDHSQHMLEAVVTSDWSALERHTRALQQLTNDPGWTALKTPEYSRHTATFINAAQDLLEAAEAHDLDATPLAYASLTLACVQCHRYVARSRIARN